MDDWCDGVVAVLPAGVTKVLLTPVPYFLCSSGLPIQIR